MSYLSYGKEFNNNLLMLMLRDQDRYEPIVAFFDHVTHDLSELSWAQTEFIAGEISKHNHSEFCNGIRAGMLSALGADYTALKDKKLASALAFAVKLNQAADTIRQEDVQTVLDAGWTEQTVEDIVGLVAIQQLYNTLANGLGFKGLTQDTFADIAQDTVCKGGYLASLRAVASQTT